MTIGASCGACAMGVTLRSPARARAQKCESHAHTASGLEGERLQRNLLLRCEEAGGGEILELVVLAARLLVEERVREQPIPQHQRTRGAVRQRLAVKVSRAPHAEVIDRTPKAADAILTLPTSA